MKTDVICIIFLLFILLLPNMILPNDPSFQWQLGEELIYKVKWSFIRLGTLKLQVQDTLTINEKLAFHIKLFIDSNPLLFFVNMHNVYDSYVDDQFNIIRFIAVEKIDNITYYANYKFDYVDSTIHLNLTDMEDTTKTIQKNLPLNEKFFDGISMIFFARAHVHHTKSDTFNAFFEGERGKVKINFSGKKEKIKIKSLKEKVETYFVDGNIGMKGIAGLSGPFKGWFTVDQQRIPLKAKLKVFIGHVNVELEKWKNWKEKMNKKNLTNESETFSTQRRNR